MNSQVVYKKKFAKKDITNFLAFDVKNNSNDTISDLFIKAELYLNKKIFEIDKRVVTPSEKLDINQTLSNVVIQLPQEMQIEKDNIQRDIIVKYFARKNKKAPWTIIKIDSVDF